MSKKNRKTAESRAVDKNVAPQNVFIVSKAQGFEVDDESNLITKVSTVDYKVVKSANGETFVIQIDAFVIAAMFNDKLPASALESGKMYIALELPDKLFKTEVNLAVLSKGEAVIVADRQAAVKPLEIIELDKG
jgi:hypothetical protein